MNTYFINIKDKTNGSMHSFEIVDTDLSNALVQALCMMEDWGYSLWDIVVTSYKEVVRNG